MYLPLQELTTHLRMETITAITRNDPALALSAIDGAIIEAKGYLARYHTTAIFAATGNQRNPLLLLFVKDMAAWHLLNILNPNADLKLRQERYNRATQWLRDVQKGLVDPHLPPAPEKDPSLTLYGSEKKNNYHW